MKIIFLIPPSETKHNSSFYEKEELCFVFEKPLLIGKNAGEKDLKCKGKRYEEALKLNNSIHEEHTIEAIKRYTGVMYNAINYAGMSGSSKEYFDKHFLILSGMYGILRSHNKIGNYKLPIETKGLITHWKDLITESLNELDVDFVVDLLPDSYKKMIDFKKINAKIIRVDFINNDGKKISHHVKKIKGKLINKICEMGKFDFKNFGSVEFEDENIVEISVSS